jgi:hypothetical protein
MPVYRYRYNLLTQEQIADQVPGPILVPASGAFPGMFEDVDAPVTSKPDLDDFMSSKGFGFVSTDPPFPPPSALIFQSLTVSLGALNGFGAVPIFTLSVAPALPPGARLLAAEIDVTPFAALGLATATGTMQGPADSKGTILAGVNFMSAGLQAPPGTSPYASRAGQAIAITLALTGSTFNLLTAGGLTANLFYGTT